MNARPDPEFFSGTMSSFIPRDKGGEDSTDNVVVACQTWNTSKGDKGLFEWLGLKEKDKLARLVAGKYLKQVMALHEKADTLDISKDRIIELCNRCILPKVCEEWGTVRGFTCFCLESIFSSPS